MLTEYNKKRNFQNTPEPAGKTASGAVKHRFIVQRHEASRLHFDFRLELNGVLKSWAVPKGPSLNSADKRFAVQTEDHPVEYIDFKGIIPEGNYGAGKMEIWDKGTYAPVDEKGKELTDKQATAWLKKGQLKFNLKGKKLNGGFVLVQLKDDAKNWLMIKHKDNYAITEIYNPDQNKTVSPAKKVPAKKSSAAKKSAPAATLKEEKNKKIKIGSHSLQLTNLTKIYWPKDNITKGDLLNYYQKMAPVILPYLKNRPLSLKRNPNGIADKGFFQKDAGENFPEWIKTAPFHADSTGKTRQLLLYHGCNDFRKASCLLITVFCIQGHNNM